MKLFILRQRQPNSSFSSSIQTTEPNQSLQTMPLSVPVAAGPLCGPASVMSDLGRSAKNMSIKLLLQCAVLILGSITLVANELGPSKAAIDSSGLKHVSDMVNTSLKNAQASTYVDDSRPLKFSDVIKASLIFETEHDQSEHYKNLIKVILRLENTHDSDVSWVSQGLLSFHAELLDEKGAPVRMPPTMASILSNPCSYVIPYGSRLDWLISARGGISMSGNIESDYALIVGSRGWLIPAEKLESYSIKITFYGFPWRRNSDIENPQYQKMMEIPLTKIKIQKTPNQAPETTILTVTERAPSSTLRASEDRVSP
jgi:hypothetical protein